MTASQIFILLVLAACVGMILISLAKWVYRSVMSNVIEFEDEAELDDDEIVSYHD